ncbi:cobalamin biosynthesis protein [Mycolicibacterium murale]|uniref:cobalamin biosynthesis protein n=1 Tax=Mycolicibacterium murale TaxID=182220 RepID=UPI001876B90C|nr:cobalamin biosynthesis protein [Mycolicibacterium murale]MCV7185875.1 cobalamin biosynthesis protein [Mycolicibacterium murale]
MFGRRAVGILAGYLADQILGDPRRGHPVAGFGTAAAALERPLYRDSRWAGAVYTGVLVGGAGLLGGALTGAAGVAAATWVALGGRSLSATGARMADLLEADDLDGARALLPSLCGRDPEFLDGAGLARAALESIAENTSDAHVAPLMWAAVAGAPGVLAYRAVNTLDAMVGNFSPRYARFGWAAARLDDVANYVGARVGGLLTVACAPLVGGSPRGAARAWFHDAAQHPSPNAGVVEAAFAGALEVRLGGPTQYRHELQIRPTLGDGRIPQVADLRRAVVLSRWVQLAAAVLAVSVASRTGRRACLRPSARCRLPRSARRLRGRAGAL